MKKFKKFSLSILSLVLVAVLSVAGTLAYLQDKDEDVNVMTLGNVKIDQQEYERILGEDGKPTTTIQEFTQDKPLYPYVGQLGWAEGEQNWDQISAPGKFKMFSMENVQDKIVFVKNTGRSDAYVRTWFALEMGELDSQRMWDIIGINVDNTNYTWSEEQFYVEIDGNKYLVMSATYNHVLAPNEYTHASLAQVYLRNDATNEDVEKLDGNNNDRYDILVFSQAVQTKGFENAETALNEAFGTEHPWVVPTIDVTTWDELQSALKEKRAIINVKNDLDGTKSETVYAQNIENNITVNWNGNEIKAGNAGNYAIIWHTNTTFNDLNLVSEGGGIGVVDGAKVVFNGGSVAVNSDSTSGRYNFYMVGEGTEVTINDGTFTFSSTQNQKRAYIYAGAGAKVIVNGGTFGKASTRSGYTAGILGDGTVIITGGTFGFDPSNWVADGYEAVVDGENWKVQAE